MAADVCAADEAEVLGEEEAEDLLPRPLLHRFFNRWRGYLAPVVGVREQLADLLRREEGLLTCEQVGAADEVLGGADDWAP